MKRLFSLLAVILLVGMVSQAQAFFGIADPINSDGAPSVKVPVHNDVNNAVTLDAGDVVVWDSSSSTGNDDLFVATTTTANTGLVAGVIWPADITAGNSGTMVVYGFAECDIAAAGVAENGFLCTTSTAGSAGGCTTANDEAQAFGIVFANSTGAAQNPCFIQ